MSLSKPLNEQSLTGNSEKNIVSLSMDDIVLILKDFSIAELMTVRRVSRSWKEAAETLLRSFQVICSQKYFDYMGDDWLSPCSENHEPDEKCVIPTKAFRSNLEAEVLRRLLSEVKIIHFPNWELYPREELQAAATSLRLWSDQIECLTCFGHRRLAEIAMPNLVHINVCLKSVEFTKSLITNSPNLQIIRIEWSEEKKGQTETFKKFFKNLPSGLKEITISYNHIYRTENNGYQVLAIMSSRAMETVTSMYIEVSCLATYNFDPLYYQLRPAPLLKNLHITKPNYHFIRSDATCNRPYILQFLKGCNPLLEDLRFDFKIPAGNLIEILIHFKDLKRLRFRSMANVNEFLTISKYLVDLHPNLQCFGIGPIFEPSGENEENVANLRKGILRLAQLKFLKILTVPLQEKWSAGCITSLKDEFTAERNLHTNIPIYLRTYQHAYYD